MKFRPSNNIQINTQNILVNLIQISTTAIPIDKADNKNMRYISNNSNLNSVTGLNNLGNTCFFNSILQNLAQTPFLEELLSEAIKSHNTNFIIKNDDDYDSELTDYEEEQHEKTTSIDNKRLSSDEESNETSSQDSSIKKQKQVFHRSIKVDELLLQLKEPNGQLTIHLLNTIKSMTQPNTAVVNPTGLFSSLCKKCPTFKGFQQHDSHELLRNLLDGIKTEELKRRQSAILDHFKINSSGSKSLDDLLKKKIKRYGRLSSYTLIDRLFGGHLLSTILCEECKNCSQRVEPFLDLSLPIVDHHDLTKKTNNLNSEKFSFNSSKLKLKKKSNKLNTQVDQFLKNIEQNDDNDNNEQLTKNQIKKLKKQSKKGKCKSKKGKLNQSDGEEEKIESINEIHIKKDEEEREVEEEEKVIEKEQEVKEEEREVKEEERETEKNELNEKIGKLIIEPMKSLTIDFKNEFKLEAMKPLFSITSSTKTNSENSDTLPSSLQLCLEKFTSKEILADKLHCEKCSLRRNNSQKVYTRSLKQYLICDLPMILTIHLKRFQQHGTRLEKLNKHVQFPLILDMSPYTSSQAINSQQNERIIYSLYGLVEHSGKLNNGHYTACIKSNNKSTPLLKNQKFSFLGQHRLCHLNKMLKNYLQNKNNSNYEINNPKKECHLEEKKDMSIDENWYYVSDTQVSEINIQRVLKSQAYILFYERMN